MWKILTSADLLSRLSDREKTTLDSAGTNPAQLEVLEDIAALVADDWRGKLGLYHVVDTRSNAVPSELMLHILADYRYRAFTRLPGLASLLDDLRVKEWERANHILDNLKDVVLAAPEPGNMPVDEAYSVPVIEVPWRPC